MSAMTIADEVLAYLKVLVWPSIAAMAILLFREPIGGLLSGLEQFEGFGFKATIRRRVDQAANDSLIALSKSGIERVGNTPQFAFIIGAYMQRALRFSADLVQSVNPSEADSMQRMRVAFERLDVALVAVLVATAVPEDENQRASRRQGRGRSLADPVLVEDYMIDITGYAGWKGVVETRDILRGVLVSICGKGAKALTSTEASNFIAAASEALRHLSALVVFVADLSGGNDAARLLGSVDV